jgi:outer membrane protein OmpA-like peptidoglycan-associated protein
MIITINVDNMKMFIFLIPIFSLFFSNVALAQPSAPEKKVFITNEATINSEGLEYSPAFLEDGIVFISTKPAAKRYKVKDKRIGENIMSIYLAKREDNGLLKTPVPFAIELLSTVHEGPVTFDRTADRMFFTRNNLKNGKKKKAKDGYVKLKIYEVEKVGEEWKNITDLPFNDDQSNTVHPSISVEGDALYFASDRPGGFGGMDIYVSYFKTGIWSEPENLGATINTDSDEVFPFIHADGTLYFASSGHAGFGGLDIFSASNNGGTWISPLNLGTPFNSEKDDFGLILDRDKKNGYLSSDRTGGRGADDIYSVYIFEGLDKTLGTEVKESKMLTFLISDLETGEMIDSAKISYTDIDNLTFSNAINAITREGKNGEDLVLRMPMNGDAPSGLTDRDGKFPLTLEAGNYVVIIEKSGFESQQIIVNTANEEGEIFISLDRPKEEVDKIANVNGKTGSEDENEDFSKTDGVDYVDDGTGIETIGEAFPSTIREGTVFQLPNIYYNFNDASIRPDAKIDLDALAAFLNTYKDIEIELSSHTDSRGGTRYNKKLSQKRAESAVSYLIAHGVDAYRLLPVGYGEEQIRNHCTDGKDCSEIEHQYNRRTEVKITKMDKEINIKFVTDDSAPTTVSGPAPSKTSTSPSKSGDYTVVAGVFKEYKNAESRNNKLQSLGYASEIISKSDTYTILVGVYSDFQEAMNAVQTLKSDYKIRSFIKR